MSRAVNVTIDEEIHNIEISGLVDNPINLGYENDVDFTDLISHLTSLIDTEEDIILQVGDYDESNEKLKIIIETLNSIFVKFSESIIITDDNDDDADLPFPS